MWKWIYNVRSFTWFVRLHFSFIPLNYDILVFFVVRCILLSTFWKPVYLSLTNNITYVFWPTEHKIRLALNIEKIYIHYTHIMRNFIHFTYHTFCITVNGIYFYFFQRRIIKIRMKYIQSHQIIMHVKIIDCDIVLWFFYVAFGNTTTLL